MNDKLLEEIKKTVADEASLYGEEVDINYDLIKILLGEKEYSLDNSYTMIRSENSYNLGFQEVNDDSEVKNSIRYGYSEYGIINFSYREQHGNTLYAIDILPQSPVGKSKLEAMISVTATDLATMKNKDHRKWPTGKAVYLTGINDLEALASLYSKIINMGINRFLKLSDDELSEHLGIEDKHLKTKAAPKPSKKAPASTKESSEPVIAQEPEDADVAIKFSKAAIALSKINEIYPELLTDKQRAFIDKHLDGSENRGEGRKNNQR